MGSGAALAAVERSHRACTLCVQAGFLERARPVFSGRATQRVMLVGQAPGSVEDEVTRPFAGRAGRQLMRWLVRAGFTSEEDVRDRVFMTSMTTCFPGRLPGGHGDRRPHAREVALCGGWLDAYLACLQPPLIIAVGTLSQARFLPGRRLDDVVGRAWDSGGEPVEGAPVGRPVIMPLPHPSGQSRWLNERGRVALLDRALDRLGELVPWAEGPSPDRLV